MPATRAVPGVQMAAGEGEAAAAVTVAAGLGLAPKVLSLLLVPLRALLIRFWTLARPPVWLKRDRPCVN